MKRYRVTCDAPVPRGYGAKAPCTFNGYRLADSEQQAGRKPCPRCGGRVQVTPRV
jgi:hypothetical protein